MCIEVDHRGYYCPKWKLVLSFWIIIRSLLSINVILGYISLSEEVGACFLHVYLTADQRRPDIDFYYRVDKGFLCGVQRNVTAVIH